MRLVLILLMGLIAFSAFSQEVHTISFDGFSFETALAQNFNIEQYAGDPPENGPGFADAPHTTITLYNDPTRPEASISIYRIADLAPYPFLEKHASALQSLLVERPDLSLFEITNENGMADVLPHVPVLPHGQILNARVEYVETDSVQGIKYITVSSAAREPFSEFTYTFQGMSQDGQYYITVNLPLETVLFPVEPVDPEIFAQQWPEYLAESVATLDAAAPDAFMPTLDTLDALVQTFTFDQ